MHLTTSLSDHLLALTREDASPAILPANLTVFGERGTVHALADGDNGKFELRYHAVVTISGFDLGFESLAHWLLPWLHQHLPNHPREAFQWSAVRIDATTADYTLELPLVETIHPELIGQQVTLHHREEPTIDTSLLPATEWELYIGDEPAPVAQWLSGDA